MARHEQDSAQHNDEQRPDTALGEVLKEFEEAETHHVGRAEAGKSDRRAGEAGDALTPNEEAQEDADHA
ncbi:hypothetical protein [Streptomyces sp. NPDC059819]|uniref:hypothetical protein n=1 Tax=unclassified Streptomyces TaxID=2593676 RepID=UPI003669E277